MVVASISNLAELTLLIGMLVDDRHNHGTTVLLEAAITCRAAAKFEMEVSARDQRSFRTNKGYISTTRPHSSCNCSCSGALSSATSSPGSNRTCTWGSNNNNNSNSNNNNNNLVCPPMHSSNTNRCPTTTCRTRISSNLLFTIGSNIRCRTTCSLCSQIRCNSPGNGNRHRSAMEDISKGFLWRTQDTCSRMRRRGTGTGDSGLVGSSSDSSTSNSSSSTCGSISHRLLPQKYSTCREGGDDNSNYRGQSNNPNSHNSSLNRNNNNPNSHSSHNSHNHNHHNSNNNNHSRLRTA